MLTSNDAQELFLGQNSCQAIWSTRPEDVTRIHLLNAGFAETSMGRQLIQGARERGIPIEYSCDPESLANSLPLASSELDSIRRQVVAMTAKKKPVLDFTDWLRGVTNAARTLPLVPFLDGVSAVENAAALARSCVHFGVRSLLFGAKHPFELDSQFGRLSAGASEEIELVRYDETSEALEALKRTGYEVLVLSPHAEVSLYEYRFAPRTVFVLGSERAGASAASFALADRQIALPNHSKLVDSLNVATMGAIMLYEAARQGIESGNVEQSRSKV